MVKKKKNLARFEKVQVPSECAAEWPLDLLYSKSELTTKNYVYTFNREGIIMQECYKDTHTVNTFIKRGELKERAFDLLIFASSSSNTDIDELADDRLLLVEQGGLFNLVIFG